MRGVATFTASLFLVLLVASASAIEVRSRNQGHLGDGPRRYKQGATLKQRLDRLRELVKRSWRETKDSIGDMIENAENGEPSLVTKTERLARDGTQAVRDKAMDAKWEIQKLTVKKTFWGRFSEFWNRTFKKNHSVNDKKKISFGEGVKKNDGWIEPKDEKTPVFDGSSKGETAIGEEEKNKAPIEEVTDKEIQIFGVKRIDDAIGSLKDILDKAKADAERNIENSNNGDDNNSNDIGEVFDLEKIKGALADAADAGSAFIQNAKETIGENIEAHARYIEQERQKREGTVDPQIQKAKESLEKAASDVNEWVNKPPQEKKEDIDKFISDVGSKLDEARKSYTAIFKRKIAEAKEALIDDSNNTSGDEKKKGWIIPK